MLKWTKVLSWFMKYIQVGNQKIGSGQPCFIIAEASSNHGGSWQRAKRLIEAAYEAGADAVKFQVFSAKTSVANYDHPLTMVKTSDHPELVKKDTRLQDLFQEIELPRNWLPKLAAYAKKLGIIFFATPADLQAVKQLEAIKTPLYKIGSYEMQDVMLLRSVARTGKPVIMSTGMCNLDEIGESLRVLRRAGAQSVVLLHCRSVYPLKPENADLNAMAAMRDKYRVPVGFSDHTLSIGVPVAAVTLGAKVIEKHFRLDDGVRTVDNSFSLGPKEFRLMVRAIRDAEIALGSKRKRVAQAEKRERLGRRSLWIIRDIKLGEVFTQDNIMALQPALGVSPFWWDKVIGKRAKRNLRANTPLKLRDF